MEVDSKNLKIILNEFDIVRIVQAITEHDENAFLLGCGRDTMEYKFYEVTGLFIGKNNVRKILDELCNRRVLQKVSEKNRYTKFLPLGE